MHIQRLTENSIKVTVTLSDLMYFDMTVEQLRPDSKELHNFLFHVMEMINEETDFNPFNGQIMMEATPSKDGVCIIVSKLASELGMKQKKIRSVSVKAKKGKCYTFYFSCFDEMCDAVSALEENELHSCELYFSEGSYCIILNPCRNCEKTASIISEYSTVQVNRPSSAVFVREHGKFIASGLDLLNIVSNLRNN